MKAAGVSPDLACYNSLLRACSFAGDSSRAMDVLQKMQADSISPNDSSYREALRSAAKEGRSDIADLIWDEAMTIKKRYDYRFQVRSSDFELLIESYWREIQSTTNHTSRINGHRRILNAYEAVQLQSPDRGMDRVSQTDIENNQQLLLKVLRSAVSIVLTQRKGEDLDDTREKVRARSIAVDIAGLNILRGEIGPAIDGKTKKALGLAREWILSYG